MLKTQGVACFLTHKRAANTLRGYRVWHTRVFDGLLVSGLAGGMKFSRRLLVVFNNVSMANKKSKKNFKKSLTRFFWI